jgi:small-conductance mechanosensitive channel/CRP-like cAMP-binding protein
MKRLILLVAILSGLVVFYQYWSALPGYFDVPLGDDASTWGHRVTGIVSWILFGLIIQRALHVFVWEGWFQKRSDIPVPKILIDMTGLMVWIAVLFATLAHEFDINVSALVTTSGVTIAVIGFALRNMIADVFSGIAFSVERPLKTGDWIELESGAVGRVLEINWRATRIITKEEVIKVVPNSFLATNLFTNYNSPESFFRDSFEIVLGYEVVPRQAERILLSAVSQVPESTRISRKPEVRIAEYTARGIRWDLRYWVPDYPSMSSLRNEVQINVLQNLQFAGIRIPRNAVDYLDLNSLPVQPGARAVDIEFLRNVDLFASLEAGELSLLCERMRSRSCVAGVPVITEGQELPGSLFIVKEGYLEVAVRNDAGDMVTVGSLNAGKIFGEMSMLTGAPPSATVTPTIDTILVEITHEDIKPLLQAREDLVVQLGEVVAERQMRNDKSLERTSPEIQFTRQEKLAARIVKGIIAFFDLKGKK